MSRALPRLAASLAIALAACRHPGHATRVSSPEELRRTAVARAFEECRDSVVKFTASRAEETVKPPADGKGPSTRVRTTHTQWGSGCIIHPAGYVLTNSHMLRFQGRRAAMLSDGKSYPTRVIAEDPANDLALMKVDAGRPLKPIKLGRSSQVIVGEPAITIGNPFGISFTVAAGIISGLGRSTATDYSHLTDMIQTDASINPGTSGGPLLNILGEMIGLCTSAKKDAQNIGFATPIDKIRSLFAALVAAEERYGFVLGIEVASDGPATVTRVARGSPAEAAGIQPGDIVAELGGQPIPSGMDYHLALIDRKGGESLPVAVLRNGRRIEATITLGEVEHRAPDHSEGLVPGVAWQHYHGAWKELPDFAKLKPAAAGALPSFSLGPYAGQENFAMRYTAHIQVPKDGVYLFSTRSDDGSRLYIGERLVVDNDGLHPAQEKRGFIPLRAGRHPICVTYFQGPGDAELKVFYEGPGITRSEVPASALFRPGP